MSPLLNMATGDSLAEELSGFPWEFGLTLDWVLQDRSLEGLTQDGPALGGGSLLVCRARLFKHSLKF